MLDPSGFELPFIQAARRPSAVLARYDETHLMKIPPPLSCLQTQSDTPELFKGTGRYRLGLGIENRFQNRILQVRNRILVVKFNFRFRLSIPMRFFFSLSVMTGASQMSAEKVHQPNELRQNSEMLLGYMSVKQSFLSCQPSLCSRRTL